MSFHAVRETNVSEQTKWAGKHCNRWRILTALLGWYLEWQKIQQNDWLFIAKVNTASSSAQSTQHEWLQLVVLAFNKRCGASYFRKGSCFNISEQTALQRTFNLLNDIIHYFFELKDRTCEFSDSSWTGLTNKVDQSKKTIISVCERRTKKRNTTRWMLFSTFLWRYGKNLNNAQLYEFQLKLFQALNVPLAKMKDIFTDFCDVVVN